MLVAPTGWLYAQTETATPNPPKSLQATTTASRKFSILGQVQKPGCYEIPANTHVSIIDAISLAGGYTRTAAQNSVTVKRVVNGKPTILKVRAGDMAHSPDAAPFEVLPGDIIKVPESWY